MALFGSTGLPIIVAVTSVAVGGRSDDGHERLRAGRRGRRDRPGLPAARSAAHPPLTGVGSCGETAAKTRVS